MTLPVRHLKLHSAALGALLVALGVAPARAQVLRGIVTDSLSGSGVVDASVAQLVDGVVQRSAPTGADGRFSLPLRGQPPFNIRVERFGYRPWTVQLDSTALRTELAVKLAPRATQLDRVEVEARREEIAFEFNGRRITEQGMLSLSHVRPCRFFVLDSVVLRDPLLFRPGVEKYYPARLYAEIRPVAMHGVLENIGIDDPRLKRDTWPCGFASFAQRSDHRDLGYSPKFRGPEIRRSPPPLDAPVHQIDAPRRVQLAQASADAPPGITRVSTSGHVAISLAAAPITLLITPDGKSDRTQNFAASAAGLRSITHLGWVGDTLWAADASIGRVVLVPPGGEPIVRTPAITPVYRDSVPGAASDPFDLDLKLPLPLPGGRWLSVQRAPAAPYPLRLEHEPARRLLAAHAPDGALQQMMTTVRPGPWRVDLGDPGPGMPVEPFTDQPLWALGPHGDHVTIVDRRIEKAVWMEIYSVTRLSLTGDTVFNVERKSPLIEMTDTAMRKAAERLQHFPALQEIMPHPATRRVLLEKSFYRPPFHPPISVLVVGADGSVWLRWPDEGGATVRWDVLDASGRPRATFTASTELNIVAGDGDRFWAWQPNGRVSELAVHTLRPKPATSR
jgi:hypothetical protein